MLTCPFCLTCLRARSSNVKNPTENSVNNSLLSLDPPQNLALLRSSLKFNTLVSQNEKLKPTMSRPAATQASKLLKSSAKGPEIGLLKLICMMVNNLIDASFQVIQHFLPRKFFLSPSFNQLIIHYYTQQM